jgi:hypothetical protein
MEEGGKTKRRRVRGRRRRIGRREGEVEGGARAKEKR